MQFRILGISRQHLEKEELLCLFSGLGLSPERHAHLQACAACSSGLKALQATLGAPSGRLLSNLPDPAKDMIEPEWNEFRAGVRDALLARSVRRGANLRRWLGTPVNAVAAWGVSVMLAIALTAGVFFWKGWGPDSSTTPLDAMDPALAGVETPLGGSGDIAGDSYIWTSSNVFDDLAQLTDSEREQFRELLEGAYGGVSTQQ